MTNMIPEVKNNFIWRSLEEYCRDGLTKDYENIYVISGTLFLPDQITVPKNESFHNDVEDGRQVIIPLGHLV